MKYLKTFISFTLVMLVCTSAYAINNFQENRIYARAKITNIEFNKMDNQQNMDIGQTSVFLTIIDGETAGEKHIAKFGGESDLPQELQWRIGDIVYIGISQTEEPGSVGYISIYDIDNNNSIIIITLLLIVAVIFIGRIKGFTSLLALVITILLLFFILIPLTLKGYPPLPISVAISIISIIITLPIIAGFKTKTLAATLGAASGIIFTALLAISISFFIHLSGIVTNEMLTIYYASDITINLKDLVLSGMIIAALGAIMDICISISSSTTEIFTANPGISEKEAFKSVLRIGTDILGSMVNTLILAYVGSSLSLILFISMRIQPGMPLGMILNHNPVLSEIVKSIVGSIGMFVSIPLTAMIAVKLHKRKINKEAINAE